MPSWKALLGEDTRLASGSPAAAPGTQLSTTTSHASQRVRQRSQPPTKRSADLLGHAAKPFARVCRRR
eukprot:5035882-Prymnesium_polylepis.1